jgi:uncharacterized protein (DUF58 family)
MRLTRFGLHGGLFHVALVAAFFGSSYSNLFFLLLGFLTLVGLGGVLAARRNLHGVNATAPDLAPSPTGTAVHASIDVHAPRPTRFGVHARISLSRGADQTELAELVGRVECLDGCANLSLQCPPLARGRYSVQRAYIESIHPFGLVRVRREFTGPRELLVYPRPLERFAGRTLLEVQRELLGRDDPGAGDLQPVSLRDHTERDGSRGIHWRASARRGRLVVQEWEGGSGSGLELLLDRRCAPEALEEALATISSLVHLARTSKDTLRLHSQGLSSSFGDGQRPWDDALRFLACAEALPPSGPAPPIVSPSVTRLPRAPEHTSSHVE